MAALIHEKLPFSWAGFYRVIGDELVLGPFQGKSACIRIGKGRGVCGAAWERDEVLVVSDVSRFEGHIACDGETRSEVVIPLRSPDGSVWGVLDVDSRVENDFGGVDVAGLIDVAERVERFLSRGR